tara:strand:+ start:78 stop:890 length:813 start_codon:yes stop_codon:yes gene_type:complete
MTLNKLIFTSFFFIFFCSCNNNDIEKNEPTNYIVLIIGQSNTHAGIGFDSELDKPVETIKQLGRFGNDNMQIVPAIEPLQHHTPSENKIGFGLTFSKLLKDYLNTEKNIILVPSGYGGTGFIDERWNKGNDLYNDAVIRVKTLIQRYPGSKLVSILWHQGETDVIYGNSSYQNDLDNFIINLRSDLNAFDVPFILGGMVPFWVDEFKERQQQQEIISNTINRHNFIGYANPEFPFRIEKEDNLHDVIHFDADGQRELGKRYFKEYLRLID